MEKDEKFFNGFDDDILSPEDFEDDDNSKSNEDAEEDDDKSNDADDLDNEKESNSGDDDDSEKVKTPEELEQEKKQKEAEELHKRNEEQKAKRLKREQEEREKALKEQAKIEAKLETIKKNPYTDKEIKDENDLKVYEIQKELENQGKDPINDLPERLKEIFVEESNKRKEEQARLEKEIEEKEEKEKKLNAELDELQNAYPDLNIDELAKDKEFIKFSAEKSDRLTQLEIYELYQVKHKKTGADDNEIDKLSKKQTKTPSSKSTNGKMKKSYLEMSDEEYLKEMKNQADFF